jgi:KDO2-lipid IV(A) lauroyltransferase
VTAVTALPLRLLLLVIRVWPKTGFGALAGVLSALLRPFAGRELRYLGGNVARVYGLPADSAFGALFKRQNIAHQIVCALETLRAIQGPAAVSVRGFDALKVPVTAAERAGKGHVMITAHLGSWELCAHYGQLAATKPFHVLAKPSKSAAVTAVLDRLRRRMGTPVLWTDRKTLLRDMLGALRRGESVGFVMDQKPEGRQGPVVDFFGIPTEFVSGPAAMAARFDCAVIAIFCLREGPFRYRLLTQELVPTGHGQKDEAALTGMMAQAIERVIRLYPEQWAWNYKRWRVTPKDPPKAANVSGAARLRR